ncbi:DUF6153 family protein [Arthrobacter sp. MPF02]|uniref:DUF6153 family protein n=1 Tax=Arthrobacter sp. MPF02 TaxID=3388492 RepID=UPI003984E090
MNAQVPAGPAALLRTGLLSAVLALVAGILGMHVMTPDHSVHGGHTAAAHGVSFRAPDSCSSGCPGAEEAGASCIPLAKTGLLAAVPPPAAAAASLEPGRGIRGAAGYSYVPPGPTPCELSISRT